MAKKKRSASQKRHRQANRVNARINAKIRASASAARGRAIAKGKTQNKARRASVSRANVRIHKRNVKSRAKARKYERENSTREAVNDPDALTLVEIAAVNEFGSEDGHVPERSYLRSTFDENREKYYRALKTGVGRAIDAILAGNDAGKFATVLDRELDLIGTRVARDVKGTIRDFTDPPNAPYTIQRKGSSKPLRDTGRLASSIDHEVRTSSGGRA